MSDSRERKCRTLSEITCHMSVGLSFEKSRVLLEIQHIKKVYIISGNEGSLDLEQIAIVNALRIQRYLHK
jgi:hypothetical protein